MHDEPDIHPDDEDEFGLLDELMEDLAQETPAQAAERARLAAAERESNRQTAERMLDWIAALPPQTTIAWNSDHLSPAYPFTHGWVDVNVPLIEAEAGWNWSWTIEVPWRADDDGDDPFIATAAFDAVVELLPARGADVDPDGNGIAMAQLRLPDDAVVGYDPRVWPELWESLLASAVPCARGDEHWLALPVWTPAAISRALGQWVRAAVGRVDIRFVWQPEIGSSPMLEQVRERAGIEEDEDEAEELPPIRSARFFDENQLPRWAVSTLLGRLAPEIERRDREIEEELAQRVAEKLAELARRRRELHGDADASFE